MNGREEKTSPLRLAWDLAMACRADVVYILREFSCLVIAVVLFPDIEQGPTIVAEAQAQQRPRPNGARTGLMDRPR